VQSRKTSAAQLRATAKYNLKTYETISARSERSERLNDLLEIGAGKAGQSKAAYILDTLRNRLQADGITPDMLPPLPDTTE